MTIDFESKKSFDDFIKHPYHAGYINDTGKKFFKDGSFVVTHSSFSTRFFKINNVREIGK